MNGRPRLKDNPFLYLLIIKYCINFVFVTTFFMVGLTLMTGYLLLTPTIVACCIVCALIENYTNRLINKHEEELKDIMSKFFVE